MSLVQASLAWTARRWWKRTHPPSVYYLPAKIWQKARAGNCILKGWGTSSTAWPGYTAWIRYLRLNNSVLLCEPITNYRGFESNFFTCILQEGAFAPSCNMAERVGVEPTVPTRGTTDFESAPFGHSGTSPKPRPHNSLAMLRIAVQQISFPTSL